MQYGFSRGDITPTRPVFLAGYAARTEPSEGVYLPLLATALALDDGASRMLWISADIIGFSEELDGPVRAVIAARCELPPEWILLSATHTHCGPAYRQLDADRWGAGVSDIIPELVDRLTDLAAAAFANLVPGTLSAVRGQSEVGVSRRLMVDGTIQMRPNPAGLLDREVVVLQVHDAAGERAGLLVSYGCHPTTMGGQLIGPDYPGWLRIGLQEALGDLPVLFVNGCAGDVKTRSVTPEGFFTGGPLSEVERCGRELAQDVLAALEQPAEPLDGPLRTRRATIDLPFDPPQDRAVYEAAAASTNRYEQSWGAQVLARLDRGEPFETSHPFHLQVFEFGPDWRLVALSGEVCCGIGLGVKARLAEAGLRGQVIAYSQAMWGYQAAERQFPEGGYEVDQWWRYRAMPARYQSDIEHRIVAAAAAVF